MSTAITRVYQTATNGQNGQERRAPYILQTYTVNGKLSPLPVGKIEHVPLREVKKDGRSTNGCMLLTPRGSSLSINDCASPLLER